MAEKEKMSIDMHQKYDKFKMLLNYIQKCEKVKELSGTTCERDRKKKIN